MSGEVESGESNLQLEERISFIRKIHSIVTFQLLLTLVVVSVLVYIPHVAYFFNNIQHNVLGKVTFFALCSLLFCHNKHSLGYFLLLILTVSVALSVGLTCAFTGGALAVGKIIILKVVTLTTVVVISSSLYIYWVTKRGRDRISLNPFLFGALLVLILFGPIQILFPPNKSADMIYGCLASTIIYGYSVYITDTFIKRFSNAQYILASASLYLFVIILFLSLFFIFIVAELIKIKKFSVVD